MTEQVYKILSSEEELALRQPIEEHVGKIQAQIDKLRENGTFKVVDFSEQIDSIKRDKIYTKEEKTKRLEELKKQLAEAKKVEEKNKQAISNLVNEAVKYLDEHYNQEYYLPVKESTKLEKTQAKVDYDEKRIVSLTLRCIIRRQSKTVRTANIVPSPLDTI